VESLRQAAPGVLVDGGFGRRIEDADTDDYVVVGAR
jgi:hypothetical protein